MKDANLYQQQASNQWAYYQAKVIREHLNRTEKLRLEFDLAGLPESNRAAGAKLLAIFANEEARMIADKKDIMKDAKKHEAERDVALRKDPYFDYAEVLLQIAIVIASVSMLANSRLVFVFSIVLALGGAFLTYNGYTLKFALPFLEGKEHVPDAIARLGQWWV
jgi:hypothetical protein